MGILGPLRETLSAYRKRKQHSIDGAVAGVGYNQYHRGYNRTVFDHSPAAGPASTAQTYDPDPGSAEFPEPDYQPYEWEMSPHPTPPLRAPLPDRPEVEQPPDYDACPMTDELFAQAMREAKGQPEIQEPLPFDHDVRAQDTVHSPESLEATLNTDAQPDPIQEMVTALDEQMQIMSPQPAMPEPQPPEEDPWEIQRQMYDEQMRMLMDPFGMGPGLMM